MSAIVDALLTAALTLFSWPTILYVVIGAMLGMLFGLLPGLGGPILLSLLIPVTYGFDPEAAIVLLAGSLGGVAFGGSISAILINTPGTPPNAATTFDGYPLARQNRAGEALGISATASALGALFGLVILALLVPVAQEVILAFSPPEFFWIAVLGLMIIAFVAQGSFLKGLVSGGLGLLISFIGFSGVVGTYRFGFGTEVLWGGIELIAALIGLFAIAEVIKLTVEETESIADKEQTAVSGGRLKGVKSVFKHWNVFGRSAIIGTLTGIIPGAGGTVANFIAYIQAAQTSDNPEEFGHGAVEGVIASEASNDAKDGGSLLPTLVFGIPGSATAAVLLAGLILHGVNPGQDLLTNDLPMLFLLLLALLVSNLVTSLIGVSIANQLAKITHVPVQLLIPVVLTLSLVGAYALRSNMFDVFVAVAFGFLGYGMVVYDYSRVAVIIALVLGPLMENSFIQSLQMSDSGYWIFITRPISFVLVLLIVLMLVMPLVRSVVSLDGIKPTLRGGG